LFIDTLRIFIDAPLDERREIIANAVIDSKQNLNPLHFVKIPFPCSTTDKK
jgi:hypothetical protein